MPDIIRLLPDSVANQIAAGEVIQRPASVVKELIENSVDAGAKSIKVIIRDAGRTLIQVIDDGSGMSETDARLAFERHSTSKISCAEDLFAITTKGFRGEALASIAAVSMVELRTRRTEDETGTLVIITGSKVEKQEICSCPSGANFSVRNLFFNVPARRKFLKSDNTELRHIINEFQKVALAHSEIKFSLTHNDSEIYNLTPGNIRQRIAGAFGKSIYQELLNLETRTTLADITGFIGKPETARKTSGEQFFFVNNRYIRHPYFHKAIIEGYQKILPPDVIPSYFIFISVDPARIDVNIHPTKTEVKFEDERAIWQILLAAVRETLGRFNIAPALDFESESYFDIPVGIGNKPIPSPPEIKIDASYNPFGEERRPSRLELVNKFEKERIAHWEKLYPGRNESFRHPEPSDNLELKKEERRVMHIRGRYIVCPVKSGLMLIDQHRAHERILYEQFIAYFDNRSATGQKTIFPEKIELDASTFYTLKEIEEDLKALGFDFEYEDNFIIKIKCYPSLTIADQGSELLKSLLETFRNLQSEPSSDVREKVALAMARAAAIPYGKTLTHDEMEQLIDTLFACKLPNYSPSGKPVISILTTEELDKRFK
ncbi:MAG: DNA mismatch repair endonuclease MutL [Bacteroidales bacterium]